MTIDEFHKKWLTHHSMLYDDINVDLKEMFKELFNNETEILLVMSGNDSASQMAKEIKQWIQFKIDSKL